MSEPIVIRVLQGILTTHSPTLEVMAAEARDLVGQDRTPTIAEALLVAVVAAFVEWEGQEIVGETAGQTPILIQFRPIPGKEDDDVPNDRAA